MKIQLNTVDKTIKIEEAVNLGEFFKTLKGLFPKDEWKEYTLESVTILTNWVNPITINPVYPVYPTWQPYYQHLYITSQTEYVNDGAITNSATGDITNSTEKLGNTGACGPCDKGLLGIPGNGIYNLEFNNN